MSDRRGPRTRETDESWWKDHWRPFMAWSYGIVCLWDFMLAPIFFAWYSHHTGTPLVTWVPLTTTGGGLYHVAMGAIIGVTSYGRSQEKVSNINASSNFQPIPAVPTVPAMPTVADAAKSADPEK